MIARLRLNVASHVVELASNDGYLLQHFVARGIPCPADRAGGQYRRGGESAGRADAGQVFREDLGRANWSRRASRPT